MALFQIQIVRYFSVFCQPSTQNECIFLGVRMSDYGSYCYAGMIYWKERVIWTPIFFWRFWLEDFEYSEFCGEIKLKFRLSLILFQPILIAIDFRSIKFSKGWIWKGRLCCVVNMMKSASFASYWISWFQIFLFLWKSEKCWG